VHGGSPIDGVTGPDEYSAVVDNNVHTNLMAERLGVTAEEVRAWQEAAKKVVIPHDDVLDGHPQSERFTEHAEWNFAATPPERYLLLHHPYFDLYRKRVVKQAEATLTDLQDLQDLHHNAHNGLRIPSLAGS
jgi:alpha,alpha-trehalose phosphorylase